MQDIPVVGVHWGIFKFVGRGGPKCVADEAIMSIPRELDENRRRMKGMYENPHLSKSCIC